MIEAESKTHGLWLANAQVHLPEPTLPHDLHSCETPKRPETWRLGPMNDPKIRRFQLEDSRA
jgi:hypothetical protein